MALRTAYELAGSDLSEADPLRRAMSHFDPGKRMQELKRKFVTHAQEKNGVSVEMGERIWAMKINLTMSHSLISGN